METKYKSISELIKKCDELRIVISELSGDKNVLGIIQEKNRIVEICLTDMNNNIVLSYLIEYYINNGNLPYSYIKK